MNIRLTIDVPVRFLTGLEAALASRKLVIRPYVKNGAFRWQLATRGPSDDMPALPPSDVADPLDEETQ